MEVDGGPAVVMVPDVKIPNVDNMSTGLKSFSGLMQNLKHIHKVKFLALLETRQRGDNASNIINKLGFDNCEKVDAIGDRGAEPVVSYSGVQSSICDSPFRVLAPWILHDGFVEVVGRSWKECGSWNAVVKDFYEAEMETEFFGNLYSEEEPTRKSYDIRGMFPNVETELTEDCFKPFNMNKVKEVAFSTGPLKASGPDGINPFFIHSQ
ncbi:reverse transcriptase [Senna tora]|uniref:Reverse transcriptase n=1 Tax=Senna tora TaxID=362788 RepID=A0A834TSN9_9FABA|nr:reverse transcriptase [Senna tora]